MPIIWIECNIKRMVCSNSSMSCCLQVPELALDTNLSGRTQCMSTAFAMKIALEHFPKVLFASFALRFSS